MAEKREFIKRRRVPRRRFERSVGLLARGQYSVCKSKEVGEGGLLLVSESELVEGQFVVLSFKLPDQAPIIVQGQIRYQSPNDKSHYGVAFTNLDFNGKRMIRGYVASKSRDQSEVLDAI